jgi:predicted Fe-Mo cluster-binding NifX family protein
MSNIENPVKLRVAVSSETGRLVDSHFGKANTFMIYEVSDAEIKHIEDREIDEEWEMGGGAPKSAGRVKAISDCDAVVTSRIGVHAQDSLKEHGVLGVEYPYQIDKGLKYALLQWKEANMQPKYP